MNDPHQTLHYKNLAIFNAIGFVMVIVVNVMASQLLINDKSPADISDEYENLFTPAGITFAIWGVIYLSLFGFIIYQLWLAFSGKRQAALEQFMQRMRNWWLISCLANSCWLFAWHYELLPVSMLLMFILLISLLAIHLNFNIALASSTTWQEKLFIQLPFSLYLGWICIATVANLAALLVYTGWDSMSIPWAIFFILICTVASSLLVLRRNNIVVGIVGIWALLGIIIKRQEAGGNTARAIVSTCIAAIAVSVITISWRLYKNSRRVTAGE